MSDLDIETLQSWVGREEVSRDIITAAPVAGLSAVLDYDVSLAMPGDPLPPLWHWLFFQPAVAASGIDVDGHPRRGGFLPPVPLPRRMWAGSNVEFLAPLHVGDAVRRISTIADISHKHGASGDLVFVKVRHEVYCEDRLSINEYQDLVYRAAIPSGSAAPEPAPTEPVWLRSLEPDPVMLFRFAALTFNAHRIHYDRDYARDREGYPGLIVQGPLTAILLLDLLRRELPDARLASFRFRGLRPLFDQRPLRLEGLPEDKAVRLWAMDSDDGLAMDALASLA